MKNILHLAMNLVIVAVYLALSRDHLILFSDSNYVFSSIAEFVTASFIAATLIIYLSYPFDGTKSHRTEFSLLILGVAGTIGAIDKFIF